MYKLSKKWNIKLKKVNWRIQLDKTWNIEQKYENKYKTWIKLRFLQFFIFMLYLFNCRKREIYKKWRRSFCSSVQTEVQNRYRHTTATLREEAEAKMVSKTEEEQVNRLESQVDNGGGGAWEYLSLVRKLKLRRSDKVLKHGLSLLNDRKSRSALGSEGIHPASSSFVGKQNSCSWFLYSVNSSVQQLITIRAYFGTRGDFRS